MKDEYLPGISDVKLPPGAMVDAFHQLSSLKIIECCKFIVIKTQHTGQHLMTNPEERFPAQVSENMPDFTGYITGSKGHHIMVKGLVPKPYTKSLVNEC